MKISGYTTTLNCIEMDYPFELCLGSMVAFCDEVCVADGGSTDGTREVISQKFPTIKIKEFPIDLSAPRWAIEADGGLKAKARKMCSGDVLWHADNDEVLDDRCHKEARELCEKMLEHDCHGVIKVPFYEFWGALDSVRGDVFDRPAVSLSSREFSIGIPDYAREFDEEDELYCRPFDSDSCQYIDKEGRIAPLLPLTNSSIVVWHLSWLDFKRKIMHYKKFWNKFHKSMYNLNLEDNAENNVMFEKPWKKVNEEDILTMSNKLAEMGPRTFHTKHKKWKGLILDLDQSQVPPQIRSWAKERNIS